MKVFQLNLPLYATQIINYFLKFKDLIQPRIRIVILTNLEIGFHGIEPTFLKLDSWSPGAGFIPIINSNA